MCIRDRAASLPLAEYVRKQITNKKVIVKYEIVADLPELKKLIAECGKIGKATIALVYVFDIPEDKIVFDVSHQVYPYKMLTGRAYGYLRREVRLRHWSWRRKLYRLCKEHRHNGMQRGRLLGLYCRRYRQEQAR